MKAFNITKRRALLIVTIILIGISASSLIVFAIASIWSPSSGPLPITETVILPQTLSAVTWNGTSVHTADTIVFTATLSPTPTHPQTVTFFYTLIPNPTSLNYVGLANLNSQAGLVFLGNATSSGSTATLTLHSPLPAETYYFIATIFTPI